MEINELLESYEEARESADEKALGMYGRLITCALRSAFTDADLAAMVENPELVKTRKTADYIWIGELIAHPIDEEETEDNSGTISVVKCSRCGWYTHGDGFFIHPTINSSTHEQVSVFCSHCGSRFEHKASAAQEGANSERKETQADTDDKKRY